MPSLRPPRLALLLAGALALGPVAALPATAATTHVTTVTTTDVTTDQATATAEVAHPIPERTRAATTADLAVQLAGEHAVGRTLSVDGVQAAEGESVAYQWLADGTPITGATQPTLVLTSAQTSKVVNVTVTVTAADGTTSSTTSTNAWRVAVAPTPGLSGRTPEGSTLTATPGAWTPGTTLTYQWLADGVPISGATRATFVTTQAQSGKRISVRVTGTLAGHQTLTRTSRLTSTRVMAWSVPTVAGTVAYGSTLTARTGSWSSGTTFTYQWYASGTRISGATGVKLKLGTAQKGKQISVRVTGKQTGYTSVAKTSTRTGRVATAGTARISGTPVYGRTLTASPGTWTPSTTLRYQWYADGVAISGATAKTLKLGAGQKDKAIRVKVTGRKSGYATVTKTSAATLQVQTAPTPKISGSPKVTYRLTAKRGTWSSGTTFTYQWYAGGTAIKGATGSTFKVGTAQLGRTIKVKVTGRKSGYPTVSRTSTATAAVTYPLVAPPRSDGSCPSWAPIKGNADSGIYHVPGQRFYKVTKAEECFRTESAAVKAGYRRSKV